MSTTSEITEKNIEKKIKTFQEELVYKYENDYPLNEDQSTALRNIAGMFNSQSPGSPISLVHGKLNSYGCIYTERMQKRNFSLIFAVTQYEGHAINQCKCALKMNIQEKTETPC